MFFEEISANTWWFSDYAVSEWGRKHTEMPSEMNISEYDELHNDVVAEEIS
ncbi:MAG: hypothetical protein WA323_28060 [Candidatus Nitrosopolaris sp.]